MLPHFVSGLGNFTLAFGNSKASASLSLVNFVLFFSCMLLGWYLFGEMGIVFAVALSGGFLYFFQIAWQEKHRPMVFLVRSCCVCGHLHCLWVRKLVDHEDCTSADSNNLSKMGAEEFCCV